MTISAVSLAIYNLFLPQLISYYLTSNGIVEYFRTLLVPSFIIKVLVNNEQNPNVIITVFINLPHSIKFFNSVMGDEMEIPFTKLTPYILPWKGRNVNTSLLVIATYLNGSNVYFSTEEIDYNPSWVFNNENIQIVGILNIIPKTMHVDYTKIQTVYESLTNKIHSLFNHPIPYPGEKEVILKFHDSNLRSF